MPWALLLHWTEDGWNVEKKWWGPGLRFWCTCEFYEILTLCGIVSFFPCFSRRSNMRASSTAWIIGVCLNTRSHHPMLLSLSCFLTVLQLWHLNMFKGGPTPLSINWVHKIGCRIDYWWLLSLSSSSWLKICVSVYLRHHLLIDADLLVLRLSALVVRPFAICLKLAEHFAAVQWSDWCPHSEGQKHSSEPAWRGAYYLCIGNEALKSLVCLLIPRFELAGWLQPGDPLARQRSIRNRLKPYVGKLNKRLSAAYLDIAWANRETVNWILITIEY